MTFHSLFTRVVLCLLVLASFAAAQVMTGTLNGTVTDPSGAVVPNVKVTATNTATAIAYIGETTDSGIYNIRFLPPGSYTIAVEAKGFKKATLPAIRLEGNQIARVDIPLEIGDSTQTVEVQAVAPIMQTESTATGDTVSGNVASTMPLNGRNFATLTLMIPGAVSTNPASMNTSGKFQGGGSRPYVNGNREQTNNFMLDGVDVNDSIDNRIGYQPSIDALEEVKVVTGNGSAEWGNAGGAIVNMTLKSGTNAFHGSAFEFFRAEDLDANGFFRNRNVSTATRQPFTRNTFGGTLGGPIVKNKLFFFMDYEGTFQRLSGPASASVAKASWRTGDLSDWLRLSTPQIVRDPSTGLTLAERTPYPGNIIPASKITNPVALKLFSNPSLYPLPNNAGTGNLGITGNYGSSSANTLNNNQGDVKVDYRISEKDNLWGRYSIGRYEQYGSVAALPVQMTGATEGPTQSAVLTWVRTFSPRVVNEARVAFSRIIINDNTIDWSGQLGPNGNQSFGIPGGQPIDGLSSVNLGAGLSGVGAGASLSFTTDNKFQYFDNLTWQAGSHLLKIGGMAIRYQQNRYYAGNNGALGIFTYSNTYSGVDYGDFLQDALSSKGRGSVTGRWGHRSWRDAIYIQDDWKIKRNLTINLGLRWEYTQPLYEVYDRQVNIQLYSGKLMYAGKDGNSRALYNSYFKQFMPRIGLAWTPGVFNNKMVIRAGYAFQSFMEGTGANLRLPLNPPFFVETNVTYDSRIPGTIKAGFQDVPVGTVTLDSPRTTPAPQLQGRLWNENLRPQFNQQMNFSMEYQLTNSTSLTGAYVGQRGTQLVAPWEANQPLAGTGPYVTWAPLNDRRPLYGPLPNVSNIAQTASPSTMDYNALQVSVRQRLSRGFEFIAAYTYGKTLTDNLGYYGSGGVSAEGAYWQNAYNREGNRGRSFFDARQNLSFGGSYQLPFGKGQKFGNSAGNAANMIIGGWSISYLMLTHTGFPVTITTGNDNTGQAVRGNVRPNSYRPLSISGAQTVDRWFGSNLSFCPAGVDDGLCAYGQAANGNFGSASIATEQMPAYFNLDFNIMKNFRFTESVNMDFRAEFFNGLNYVAWGNPGRSISDPANFGTITSQIGSPRNIQLGLKLNF